MQVESACTSSAQRITHILCCCALPVAGSALAAAAAVCLFTAKESRNVRVAPGTNSMSGVVYIKGV
jgi:hypothetical protein